MIPRCTFHSENDASQEAEQCKLVKRLESRLVKSIDVRLQDCGNMSARYQTARFCLLEKFNIPLQEVIDGSLCAGGKL